MHVSAAMTSSLVKSYFSLRIHSCSLVPKNFSALSWLAIMFRMIKCKFMQVSPTLLSFQRVCFKFKWVWSLIFSHMLTHAFNVPRKIFYVGNCEYVNSLDWSVQNGALEWSTGGPYRLMLT